MYNSNPKIFRIVHFTKGFGKAFFWDRIFCFGIDESLWNDYAQRLKKVMGIKHAILMTQVRSDLDKMQIVATSQLEGVEFSSFRVSARRQYKESHLSSQEINEAVGQYIQSIYLKPVKLKKAMV